MIGGWKNRRQDTRMYVKLCVKMNGWKDGEMDGWIHLSELSVQLQNWLEGH